jgi:hypothetical protein
MKCKISHWKSEVKGEFGNPWTESLKFKCGIPIMFIPTYKYLSFYYIIYIYIYIFDI